MPRWSEIPAKQTAEERKRSRKALTCVSASLGDESEEASQRSKGGQRVFDVNDQSNEVCGPQKQPE